ncbi:MAG: polysaccharide biosynthesis tyrosine autokinase, partial [Flavobacteriaceae bacterium]|nr:polysaccharide biosynthesis tyrosine autokinase [Flavobacteriaceae bacterium]
MENEFTTQENKNGFDIRLEINKYLPFWFWFVGFTAASLFIAHFYLRYSPPVFQNSAKIKILDNSNSPFKMSTEGIFIVGKSKAKLGNDLQIIKSDRILRAVARELNLTTAYYLPGRIMNSEQWKNCPVKIEWLTTDNFLAEKSVSLNLTITKKGFKIEELGNKEMIFDKRYVINNIPFKIKSNIRELADFYNKKYIIQKSTLSGVVSYLTGSVSASVLSDESDVVVLSMRGLNQEKSKDIVNCLIKVYNEDGIKDRQLAYKNTIEFVNDRFQYLVNELDSIENYKIGYKKKIDINSIEELANSTAGRKSSYEEKILDLESQMSMSSFLNVSIKPGTYKQLPTNIGILNVNVNSFISEYNQLINERDKLLISAGKNNPALKVINEKLPQIQENIFSSIKLYQDEIRASIKNIKKNQSENNSLYSSVPEKEKNFKSIERQQNIKENLYLLLLQKREEAGINMAITQPSVKVLEYASNGYKVAPKNNTIYLIALIIGLGIPLLLLFLKFYFDTKIHNKIDVKNIVKDIPIIGEIPFIKEDKYIQINDRSILAEAYRNVRTNINYLLPASNKKDGNVIFSTSSIKGEGKTFNAINMGLIITQMKKKVLIIGADLRNPQLHKYVGLEKEKRGLTNYLFDQEIEYKSIINKNIIDNQYLDVIISGSIPPNPAELISNGRFEKLLNIVKAEYDYIIVDSAPTILVTDTLLITNLADLVIYVTRADLTEKHVVEYSRDLFLQG